MGARYVNNQKVVSRGYTSDFPCLSISQFKQEGLLGIEGHERIEVYWEPFDFWAILHVWGYPDRWGISIAGKRPYCPVWFDLVHEPARFGGRRWYFLCRESGIRCRDLYFVAPIFAPRKVHRLTYRSQGEGELDRLISRIEKIDARLEGPFRNRARGENRRRLEAERVAWDQLALSRFLVAPTLLNDAQTAKGRRAVRDNCVRAFAEDLTWKLVDEPNSRCLKLREWLPCPGAIAKTHREARNSGASLRIDATVLERLGLLAPGRVWSGAVDWERAGCPRFEITVDTRRGPPYPLFLEGPRWHRQIFWIDWFAAPFGRTHPFFVSPITAKKSRDLFPHRGRFELTPHVVSLTGIP